MFKLTPEVQDAFDKLLNYYLEASTKILAKDKILIPMGVTIDYKGNLELIALAPDGEAKVSDTAEHLRSYRALLGSKEDSYASLLGYDVRIKNDPNYKDGIAIELESRTGSRVLLTLPYRFSGLLRNKLISGDIRRESPGPASIY